MTTSPSLSYLSLFLFLTHTLSVSLVPLSLSRMFWPNTAGADLTDILLGSNDCALFNLVTVNLDNNQLSSLGGLAHLPHLRTLSLKGNRIRRLYTERCACSSLTFP